MISLFSDAHAAHAPAFEIFRGDRVPCFETPQRAVFVRDQLVVRGHTLHAPQVDSRPVLAQVHSARYLRFLEGAWADWLALDTANGDRQPFPSGWPVRTLPQRPRACQLHRAAGPVRHGQRLPAGGWHLAGRQGRGGRGGQRCGVA